MPVELLRRLGPRIPECDYVTRFFAPRYGVDEDEVTGSIHGLLVPYWLKKLGKVKMRANQLIATRHFT